MIHIRSSKEIKKITKACQIVKDALNLIEKEISAGITTLELDKIAEDFIVSKGAKPGFKGLYGYPATLCVSIEEEVVHGIPTNRILEFLDTRSSINFRALLKLSAVFSKLIICSFL